MIKRLIKWLRGREEDYNQTEKARLCAPCDTPCGQDLCKKVGCLTMDMRTTSLLLRLLVKRLQDYGYEFNDLSPTKEEVMAAYKATGFTEVTRNNVVRLEDYRKDD